MNWPPRLYDLDTFLFLQACIIVQEYADNPQTLDHLEDKIHQAVANIRQSDQKLERSVASGTFERYLVLNITALSKIQHKANNKLIYLSVVVLFKIYILSVLMKNLL